MFMLDPKFTRQRNASVLSALTGLAWGGGSLGNALHAQINWTISWIWMPSRLHEYKHPYVEYLDLGCLKIIDIYILHMHIIIYLYMRKHEMLKRALTRTVAWTFSNPWVLVCTVYLHWMWPSTQYHLQPDVCFCFFVITIRWYSN